MHFCTTKHDVQKVLRILVESFQTDIDSYLGEKVT